MGALIATLLCLAMLAPQQSGAAVKARPADGFVDSIGVGVHTPFSDTPYASEFATVKQRLQELGVRHVRDDLFPDRPDQYQRLDELAAAGIGSTLIVGSPADGIAGLEELLSVAADRDGLEALEGPNEYSTSGDPDWKPNLIAYQEALYEQAKADPALASLPVVGPSIVHGDQEELGDVSDSLDYGNIHSYPQGNPPDKLGSFIKNAELNSGSKPIVATETGYHTALAWEGENPPVSEAAMAVYMPRLLFEYFRWGIARTFSYELLDEFPDPGLEEKESNFGLLRNDLSRKPAFDALRNTIGILEDPGPSFATGSLDYALSEAGVELPGPESTGLHKVLLQKRDGSFYLVLWRLASVWDPLQGEPLPAVTEPVEVRVDPGLVAAAEYRPNSSSGPVWSATGPSQPLTVEVGPEVVILRLVPGTPAPEPEPGGAPPAPPQPAARPERVIGPQAPPGKAAPKCVVPALQGRKLRVARAELRRSHCRLGGIAGRRTESSRVVSQRPRPSRVLTAGHRVNVKLRPGG
jgi:hypothetical protein